MIAMITMVALISAFLLASAMSRTSSEVRLDNDRRTQLALREAKAALIGYAASLAWDNDFPTSGTPPSSNVQPGALPCPSADESGDAANSCSSSATRVGRLPWKKIGTPDLRDGSGNLLWYALSANFVKNPGTTVINSDTAGTLSIYDDQYSTSTISKSQIVAVIIAPGPALAWYNPVTDTNFTQDRTNNTTATAYLECRNKQLADEFSTSAPPASSSVTSSCPYLATTPTAGIFNDQLITITQAELMAAVEPAVAARIERDVKPYLTSYYSLWGRYPFPVAFSPGPGTSGTRAQSSYKNTPTSLTGTTTNLSTSVTGLSSTSQLVVGMTVGGLNVDLDTTIASIASGTSITLSKVTTASGAGTGTLTFSPSEGLLPVLDSTLTTYAWGAGLGAVTKTGGAGTISGTPSCALSGTSWRCSFNGTGANCGSLSGCAFTITVNVDGQVTNVGNTLAKYTTGLDVDDFMHPASSVTRTGTTSVSAASIGISLLSSGNGRVRYSATLGYTAPCVSGFFFCSSLGTRAITVTIPSDPAYIYTSGAASTDPNSGWFIKGQWYRQVYYSVAPGYLPGGSGSCTTGTNCLTVSDLSSTTYPITNDKRAILVFMGRTLNGSARPSATLSDYLEGLNASTGDRSFQHASAVSPSINDRVVVVAP